MAPMSRRSELVFIALLAAATNFAYLYYSHGDYFFPDSFTYLAPANSLAHGLGFTASGLAETMRTPGYPLLLVLLGRNPLVVLVVQHLLNVALAVAIAMLVVRRGGSRVTAMLAAILFAIDTPSLHHANKVLTETAFTALLFIVIMLTLRIVEAPTTRALVIDGLLVGVLVMIRPVAIAWCFVLAIFFALHRVRRIALFVAAALVIPLLWGIRNQRATGVFTISSIAGTNMLLHRGAAALAMENEDDDFASALSDAQEELLDRADEVCEREHTPETHAARAAVYSRIGRQVVLQHPRGAIFATVRGLLVNAFDSDWQAMMIVSRIPPSIVELALTALAAITFAAAVAGIIALWPRDRSLALLIALAAGYFLFMSAGSEAEARFRVPVAPLLAIAAAYGITAVRPIRPPS
jgi:hypothetical protein